MTESEMMSTLMDQIQKSIKNLKQLNLMVVGKTGVGKSTLINSVFHENLVETGVGRPVTQGLQEISKEDFPLHLWDTQGFEIGRGNYADILKNITDEIAKRNKELKLDQRIHCIWYCISTPSHRVEDAEIEAIRGFIKTNVPVIIVLTQSFSKTQAKEMQNHLKHDYPDLPVSQIVPVLAQDYEFDEDRVVLASGLDRLGEVMEQVLPEELRDSLENAQKASLKSKRQKAYAVVVSSAAAAAAEAAVPVPLADSAMMIPTQMTMLGSITALFSTSVTKGMLRGLVSTVIGSMGATVAGKTIFANALKLIPGLGSVAGGAISATTASALTVAVGTGYVELMSAVYTGEIKKEVLGTEEGKKLFRHYVKNYKKYKPE